MDAHTYQSEPSTVIKFYDIQQSEWNITYQSDASIGMEKHRAIAMYDGRELFSRGWPTGARWGGGEIGHKVGRR